MDRYISRPQMGGMISATCARYLKSLGLARELVQYSGYRPYNRSLRVRFGPIGEHYAGSYLYADTGKANYAALAYPDGSQRCLLEVRYSQFRYREEQGGRANLVIIGANLPATILANAVDRPVTSVIDLSDPNLEWLSSPELIIVKAVQIKVRDPYGSTVAKDAVQISVRDKWALEYWDCLPSVKIELSERKAIHFRDIVEKWHPHTCNRDCYHRVRDYP